VEHRISWMSLVGFCLGATVVAALAFAIIVAGASAALASHRGETQSSDDARDVAPQTTSPQPGTRFSGMITDSRCGARHMRNSHENAAECARECFRRGASYVLVDGDQRYTLIGGEASLAKLAGERANVMGTRQGDAILVDSAAALF
jgi:hypothetical protein